MAGVSVVNRKRLYLGANYYQKCQNTDAIAEKLSFLIKSDFYVPSDSKKIEIANLYLGAGNYKRAERYLTAVHSQDGYLNLVQALLENNDQKSAEIVIKKIQNPDTKSELELDMQILSGNFDKFREITGKEELSLTHLLYIINTREYKACASGGALCVKLRELAAQNSRSTELELKFADYLTDHNQPYLAKFIVERIIAENPTIVDAFTLHAKILVALGETQNGLLSVEKAINLRPDLLWLYARASEYAGMSAEPELSRYYLEKQEYLRKINK